MFLVRYIFLLELVCQLLVAFRFGFNEFRQRVLQIDSLGMLALQIGLFFSQLLFLDSFVKSVKEAVFLLR